MGLGLYRNMQPQPPKWLLEALRLHPNQTGHRRPPPVCSAAASSFSRSRLFRVACRGARSALACGCCWRVSFALSCCLHVFRRVEFLTLGVFLRNRQPADPQADRPAGEGAAIPSVEVSKWRPTSRGVPAFFLLGAHLALLGSS